MNKKAAALLILAFVILIAPLLYALGQFFFTDAKIVPVYFTHYYLARVDAGQDERALLIDYLKGEGYALKEQNAQRMVFTRDGETKEVRATDIKCLLRDGRLTTDFRLPQKTNAPPTPKR
jgi:hypothetical protein